MTVVTDIHEGVATITLDDGKANAVNFDLVDAVHAALDEAEANANAIVIAGREGKFSAGFDLSIMKEGGPETASKLVNAGGKLATRIFACGKPTVAACTGHGIAMGAILLCAFDTRIGAAGKYKIGLNETAIGMVLPEFGVILPPFRIVHHMHTRAIIQAELFAPDMAAQIGYLDEVVALENVVETAQAKAAYFAQAPAKAYAGNKALVRGDLIAKLNASFERPSTFS